MIKFTENERFGCIYFTTDFFKKDIVDVYSNIKTSDIIHKPSEFHITLVYGLTGIYKSVFDEYNINDFINYLKSINNNSEQITFELDSFDLFKNDDKDVLFIRVKQNEILDKLYSYIETTYPVEKLYNNEKTFHITIAELHKGTGEYYKNLLNKYYTLDNINFHLTNKIKYSDMDFDRTILFAPSMKMHSKLIFNSDDTK